MISPKNVEFAKLISENAIYSSRRLVPKAGTPMSALVSSIVGIGETGTWEEIIALSDSLNTVSGTHDTIQNDVAKVCGNIVSTIISVARGDVNARIRETMEAVEKKRLEAAARKASSLPIVRSIELDGLFTDEMFVAMASNYKDSNMSYDTTILSKAFNEMATVMSDNDYNDAIKTGSSGIDKKVNTLLGDNPSMEMGGVSWYPDQPMERRSLKNLTYTFLFLTGLCNGRVEKLMAFCEDSVVMAEIIAYKAAVGRRLSTLIDRLTKCTKDGIMVLPPGIESYDPNYEIVVMGKPYRQWIEKEGGSPEAMVGFALEIRAGAVATESLVGELKANPAKYVERYAQEIRTIEMMRVNAEIKDTPLVIHEYLAGVILKMDIEPNAKIALQTKLNKAMETPYYGDTNVQFFIRDIVCSTFVEGDDVKRVLSDIDVCLKNNEGCTMDYAVLMALINLIGRFVAGQVEVIAGV